MIDTITIYWPSGTIDVLNNVNINSTLTVIEGQTLSVSSLELSEINIYPNPADDFITIDTINSLEGAIISIFDINGRRVLNYKQNANSNKVDVSSLSIGEYIIRVVTADGLMASKKLIKK